tara:strand:+ start:3254 stop:3391 length:138 start_codon:yes stop_codon:yes gene_type:complete
MSNKNSTTRLTPQNVGKLVEEIAKTQTGTPNAASKRLYHSIYNHL